MKDVITIRNFEIGDKDNVIKLLKFNIPNFFAITEETDFIKYLEAERELYFVLLFNKKIIGCGGINFESNMTIGKISWDIIHPSHQGKSFGTMLLKHRINLLLNLNSIQKITVRTSQVAYKFYEKNGFELLEVIKDYWAAGFDLYKMEYKRKEV